MKFTPDERFDMVRAIVSSVARKEQMSAVILGEGGLGKSHSVLQGLTDAGMVDISECDMEDTVTVDDETGQLLSSTQPIEQPVDKSDKRNLPKNPLAQYLLNETKSTEQRYEVDEEEFVSTDKLYIQIKGYVTAKGLYEILYKYNGMCIVFDDCDKALTDPTAEMLFKGALDSNPVRRITWMSSRLDGLPSSFDFTGTVVFISNLKMDQIDQALKSRSVCIDLTLTTDEKIERMWSIAMSDSFMSHVDKEKIKEVMNIVVELKDQMKDLNMRTLIKGINLRLSVPNWANTFKYVCLSN